VLRTVLDTDSIADTRGRFPALGDRVLHDSNITIEELPC
jgi:hypothetical protein